MLFIRDQNRVMHLERVTACQDTLFHIAWVGEKPQGTNHPWRIENIHVRRTLISLEIHRCRCLQRKPHRPHAMFMWSYINVTSENDGLRLPIYAVPQVTSVREGRCWCQPGRAPTYLGTLSVSFVQSHVTRGTGTCCIVCLWK